MKISKQSTNIAVSFVLVLTLLLVMVLFGLNRMNLMQSKLDAITREHNVKTDLMVSIRNALYERQLRLRDIMLIQDPFERDKAAAAFSRFELDVVKARDQILAMQLNKDEKKLLNEIRKNMQLAYQSQFKIIEDSIFHYDQEITSASLEQAFTPQEVVMEKVEQMIRLQKNATLKAVMDAEKSYAETKVSVYFLGGGALIFGVLIALLVIRHSETQSRKVAEAMSEIEQSHNLLEDRVIERTEELVKLRDEALELNKAKDAFLANMSHELRTPLNIIVGYSELLEEDAQEDGNKKLIADLKKIQSAATHQLTLINSILDISKIEEGQLDIHPLDFDVESLLHEINEASKPLMSKNHNTLTIDCTHGIGMMFSDNIRIRQILLNLLSNAAKFTDKGTVSLNVSKDSESNEIQFQVIDNGVGIPEKYMDYLFEKFTQADSSTTRQFGGTGLGLSISKQLSHILKGDITVSSEEGNGSCFTLTLPIVYSS
jgi:signal transduction histidine kinase